MIHTAPAAIPATNPADCATVAVLSFRALPQLPRASPPRTSAPSPPMTIRPARAGHATHKPHKIRGDDRANELRHENSLPKPPLVDQEVDLCRILAEGGEEGAKQNKRDQQRKQGNQDRLDAVLPDG